MNLDELIHRLESISCDPVILKLARLLATWKSDNSTAAELHRDVERYLGNTWVEKDAEHEQMYALWSEFRDQSITRIGGMTMNERLYYFSLLKRFDACVDEANRLAVYRKLNAAA